MTNEFSRDDIEKASQDQEVDNDRERERMRKESSFFGLKKNKNKTETPPEETLQDDYLSEEEDHPESLPEDDLDQQPSSLKSSIKEILHNSKIIIPVVAVLAFGLGFKMHHTQPEQPLYHSTMVWSSPEEEAWYQELAHQNKGLLAKRHCDGSGAFNVPEAGRTACFLWIR